jgi:hypothetical protein
MDAAIEMRLDRILKHMDRTIALLTWQVGLVILLGIAQLVLSAQILSQL